MSASSSSSVSSSSSSSSSTFDCPSSSSSSSPASCLSTSFSACIQSVPEAHAFSDTPKMAVAEKTHRPISSVVAPPLLLMIHAQGCDACGDADITLAFLHTNMTLVEARHWFTYRTTGVSYHTCPLEQRWGRRGTRSDYAEREMETMLSRHAMSGSNIVVAGEAIPQHARQLRARFPRFGAQLPHRYLDLSAFFTMSAMQWYDAFADRVDSRSDHPSTLTIPFLGSIRAFSTLNRWAQLLKMVSHNCGRIEVFSAVLREMRRPILAPARDASKKVESSDTTTDTATMATAEAAVSPRSHVSVPLPESRIAEVPLTSRRPRYCMFIDMEMTRIDHVHRGLPLELQARVCGVGPDVPEIDRCGGVVFQERAKIIQSLSAWSAVHHARSGLLEECGRSTEPSDMLDQRLVKWATGASWSRDVVVLVGNSIWCDMEFMSVYFPRFFRYLTATIAYTLDMTSLHMARVIGWIRDDDGDDPILLGSMGHHRSSSDVSLCIHRLRRIRSRFESVRQHQLRQASRLSPSSPPPSLTSSPPHSSSVSSSFSAPCAPSPPSPSASTLSWTYSGSYDEKIGRRQRSFATRIQETSSPTTGSDMCPSEPSSSSSSSPSSSSSSSPVSPSSPSVSPARSVYNHIKRQQQPSQPRYPPRQKQRTHKQDRVLFPPVSAMLDDPSSDQVSTMVGARPTSRGMLEMPRGKTMKRATLTVSIVSPSPPSPTPTWVDLVRKWDMLSDTR